MKNNPKIFNINTFNFYRRYVKPSELDKIFIKLIENEEKKMIVKKDISEKKKINSPKSNNNSKNSNKKNNNEYDSEKTKNINLNLIFPKISLERIKKIRDLFLEFDADKSRTFDQDEIQLMFNMNKIPITSEEVKELFGFTNSKKDINFKEFIQLTVNEHFSNKFKKLIMEKIRYRTHKGDICPNDFNDMLSHLCEFGKISKNLKTKAKEEHMKYPAENEKNVSKSYEPSQTKSLSPRKSLFSEIIQNLNENKIKEKNFDFNNEKDINKIRYNPNLFQKETEFNNFTEISNKKLLRFSRYLDKTNIRDKILQKKERLVNSLKTININNSDIANNYISYYPIEKIFKKGKNNTILSFSFKKNNQNISSIKVLNTERNKSFKNKKVNGNIYYLSNEIKKNKLIKKIKNYPNLNYQTSKTKKEKIKEKEYASILARIRMNNNHLPIISNKDSYSEKTFINTGLYSNIALNM